MAAYDKSALIKDDVYGYYASCAYQETDLLKQLRLKTLQQTGGQMMSPPEQCQLLSFLIQLTRAKQALEIGTFTGYGSLWMAQALPDQGRLITCDINEGPLSTAKKYWQEAGVLARIESRIGLAEQVLMDLLQEQGEGSFDFIYLDADKINYDRYYESSLKLLKADGVLAIDNVLYFGSYVHVDESKAALAIRNLNEKIKRDKRVRMVMLPVGGGLTLVSKV